MSQTADKWDNFSRIKIIPEHAQVGGCQDELSHKSNV